jgi:manganese-dependent inorganic pyrophosphatase
MNKYTLTGLSVVENKNKYYGYISLKEIAKEIINGDFHKIDTSYGNIVNTLKGKGLIKVDKEISGNVKVSTFPTDDFIKKARIDKDSILICDSRQAIIRFAIANKVKLLVLVENANLSTQLTKEAIENKVNVISTPYNSYEVGKIISLCNYIKNYMRAEDDSVTFNEIDYLSDFLDKSKQLKHNNYPIVNSRGECSGILTLTDTNNLNRKKVILVDHNNTNQSVDGLDEAEIIEIIDHHNIGDIVTSQPINFRNMALGSACSIAYYLYKEANVKITKPIAGLMLSGILSDTLILKSPTTTEKDKLIAKELASIAKVDIEKYGMALLESGISIEGLSAKDIIFRDFKTYNIGEDSMVIGQVFTTDFGTYKNIKEDIIKELDDIMEHHGYNICALFVTNIITNDSNVLYARKCEDLIRIAYGLSSIEEGQLLEGVMSRKKQMVPNLMSVIDHT